MTNIDELSRAIGRIEGKIDGILEQIKKTNSCIVDHDKRINECESKLDEARGSVKTIAIFWGVVITLINIVISWFR